MIREKSVPLHMKLYLHYTQESFRVASLILNKSFYCHLQTDRAAMLDEIVDYVKFLRLQVKVIVCFG